MKIFDKMKSGSQKGKSEQDALAKVYAEFSERREQDLENCPNCTSGREGTKQMLRILNKACSQNAETLDLATFEELATLVEKTSRCKLCRKSVSSVMSTLHG